MLPACPAFGGIPPWAGDALYRLSYDGVSNGEIISKRGVFVKSGYLGWGYHSTIDRKRVRPYNLPVNE
jgi:hypothetical protein